MPLARLSSGVIDNICFLTSTVSTLLIRSSGMVNCSSVCSVFGKDLYYWFFFVFMAKREVVRRLEACELSELIGLESDPRVLVKLVFIMNLYHGDSVESASVRVGCTKMTGDNWLDAWNLEGYEGLVPGYSVGRPSKLDEVQREYLISLLSWRSDWLLDEIKELFRVFFNINYCDSWIREVLRNLGLKHAKPYSMDYRRPVDAEEVLKKALTPYSWNEKTLF